MKAGPRVYCTGSDYTDIIRVSVCEMSAAKFPVRISRFQVYSQRLVVGCRVQAQNRVCTSHEDWTVYLTGGSRVCVCMKRCMYGIECIIMTLCKGLQVSRCIGLGIARERDVAYGIS